MRCNRPLRQSASTEANIGPVCLRRLRPAPKRQRLQMFQRAAAQADPRQVDWVKEAACLQGPSA